MIAFKTYRQAPSDQVPTDIPLDWPWREEVISDDQVDDYEALGFMILGADEYVLYKASYQLAYDAWYATARIVKFQPITPRQIRLELFYRGVTEEMIDANLGSLPEPQRSIALIEWNHSIYFERDHPLVISVGTALGYTTADMDSLWTNASQL